MNGNEIIQFAYLNNFKFHNVLSVDICLENTVEEKGPYLAPVWLKISTVFNVSMSILSPETDALTDGKIVEQEIHPLLYT